ncbi:CDC25-like phosphatase Ych1p [[Candida] anglica]
MASTLARRGIPYLEPETLCAWMQSREDFQIMDVRDCDFDEGGHIKGAVNYEYRSFQNNLREIVASEVPKKRVFVFHCMRSQQRGPRCALRFKTYIDETLNNLDIEVYVLRGGFIKWYKKYGETQYTEKATTANIL